jgi:16S rRNA (guanine527-N7)-methyltransferase
LKNRNHPGSVQWGQLIADGAGQLGIEISAAQVEILACHAAELIKWNKKMNLTRISDPAEMAIKHYVDSLACVPYIPVGARVLDIGSGGGFPGVPAAVAARPGNVLMLDSVRKKISFLKHAIRLMRLNNAEAFHIRAQELERETAYGEFFDTVICRALAGIDRILQLAFPLLKNGGRVVALKGRIARTDQECRELAGKSGKVAGWGAIRSVAYRLPLLNVERSIVLIHKTEKKRKMNTP